MAAIRSPHPPITASTSACQLRNIGMYRSVPITKLGRRVGGYSRTTTSLSLRQHTHATKQLQDAVAVLTFEPTTYPIWWFSSQEKVCTWTINVVTYQRRDLDSAAHPYYVILFEIFCKDYYYNHVTVWLLSFFLAVLCYCVIICPSVLFGEQAISQQQQQQQKQ